MERKKRAGRVSLAARQGLQSLEDAVIIPSFRWIKRRINYIHKTVRTKHDERAEDAEDKADVKDKYAFMLQKYYSSIPNWHEHPDSKNKNPFDPANHNYGCAGEVFFLNKYEKTDPELFEQLMQIRIKYFKELENKKEIKHQ